VFSQFGGRDGRIVYELKLDLGTEGDDMYIHLDMAISSKMIAG